MLTQQKIYLWWSRKQALIYSTLTDKNDPFEQTVISKIIIFQNEILHKTNIKKSTIKKSTYSGI